VVDLVIATREAYTYGTELGDLIQFGVSPRATISLTLTAKANAFLEGRDYVTPDDVKTMAPSVLRHRIILTYEAEAEEKSTDDVIRTILEAVPVP
jgi:MoxR-like ATPase